MQKSPILTEQFLFIKELKEVNILIIEGHQMMRGLESDVMKKIFPQAEVYTPKNLDETFHFLERLKLDLVLLDGNLKNWKGEGKDMLGQQLTPLIRKSSPECVILAISQDTDFGRQMLMDKDADHYWSKADFAELEKKFK
jgi:response regulator of citrate/malate metabolism